VRDDGDGACRKMSQSSAALLEFLSRRAEYLVVGMPIGWVLKIDIHRFIERFKNFRDFISDIARSAEFPPGVLRSLDYLSQWQLARSNLCDGLIVTRSLVVSDMVFASPNFFIFVVRRYSGVSWLEVCRKLAAGRELSRGRVQVASEYRLGGEALFARSEALFVASPCERAARNARLAGCLSPWDCRFVKEVAAPQSVAWSPRRPAAIHVCMSWGVAECSTAVEAIPQVFLATSRGESSAAVSMRFLIDDSQKYAGIDEIAHQS
jgi:hypothetical protein